jgi:hypothetical protein
MARLTIARKERMTVFIQAKLAAPRPMSIGGRIDGPVRLLQAPEWA